MERPGIQEIRKSREMKKIVIPLIGLVIWIWATLSLAARDLEMKGRQLISQKPPFTLDLPSEFVLVHSFSHENPAEYSLTRVYFLVKTKARQVEEMAILQVGDRTDPQAGPITAPPLKPYTDERMYVKGKIQKGDLSIDHLIQLMAWNPDAPSLRPLTKKNIVIPSRWALQGQILFLYDGEHVVLLRYSKDIHSFGLKVSDEKGRWKRETISGNEKKVYGIFRKILTKMIDSIRVTTN
jgi:hypothetical protein